MKRGELDTFEKLVGQLSSLYDELAILSKKDPTDAVNKFKLRFVNNLLSQANQFLGKEYIPFRDFEQFDEDEVPQNSDVVFIVSQYLQCFEKLRADNVQRIFSTWYWMIEPEEGEEASEDGFVHVETVRPKRLKG